MKSLFVKALNEVGILFDEEDVKQDSNIVYLNLMNNLKIGLTSETDRSCVFVGESLKDNHKITLRGFLTFDSVLIGIKAIRKSEQYKFAIMRQRYI